MDESPKKFDRNIKIPIPSFLESVLPDWQDGIKSDVAAEAFYDLFQEVLKEQGLDLTKNLKVLEAGSGNAIFLDFLRQKGVNAVGVDAELRGSKESPQVIARIEKLPFAKESFDVVLSSHLVFDAKVYDQDQDLMMKEIYRVLKPGGIFLANGETRIRTLPIKGFDQIYKKDTIILYKKS